MRTTGTRAEGARGLRVWRLLVAVTALYAMALGGVLTGAAGAWNAHAHVICQQIAAQDQGGTSGDQAPAGSHHMSDCCVAASAAGMDLQSVVGADLIWPPDRALGPIRRSATTVTIRGPPRGFAHSRAPPFESIA